MLTYLSALLPDTSWPFWPHFWLLFVSILASFAVAAGIILEANEYSASTHRVAKWLVIGGVAIEAACTVSLFVFDERISGAQQSTILEQQSQIISLQKSSDFLLAQGQELAALAGRARREATNATERAAQLEKDATTARLEIANANTRAAEASEKAAKAELALEQFRAPRKIRLWQSMTETLSAFKGTPFDIGIQTESEPIIFLGQLTQILEAAGWVWKPSSELQGLQFKALGKPPMALIVLRGGVQVRIAKSRLSEWGKAIAALSDALTAENLANVAQAVDGVNDSAVHIHIGTKE